MSEREQVEAQPTDEASELTVRELEQVTGGAVVDYFSHTRKAGDAESFSWGVTQVVMP